MSDSSPKYEKWRKWPVCPDCKEEATLNDEDKLIMKCYNSNCKVISFAVDEKARVRKVTRGKKNFDDAQPKTSVKF